MGEKAKAAMVELFDPPPTGSAARKDVMSRFSPQLAMPGIIALPGFMPAFINSVMMIWATEIGDKTFFIAAIMAMRHNAAVVFAGAIAALAIMTVLSAAMGFALPNLMPKEYTHYGAAVLFLYFGFKLLKEGLAMEHASLMDSEELEEAEQELSNKKDDAASSRTDLEAAGSAAAAAEAERQQEQERLHQVFWQALTLTFIAEWGDRSQIATIALAAAKNPYGVVVGGVVGHSMCTGIACVGGKYLANRVSEKSVTLFGGAMFLLFALHSFIFDIAAS